MANHALLWFRNDLRIEDNPALLKALGANCKLALFFHSEIQWRKHQMADIKIDLILRHVDLLREQLSKLGIKLIVLQAENYQEQCNHLKDFCEQHQISEVFANSELELNEVIRDRQVQESDVNLILSEADTIVKKGAILNKEGNMYRVFSAFKRAWLSHVQLAGFEYYELDTTQKSAVNQVPRPSSLPSSPILENSPVAHSSSHKWPLATEVITNALPNFYQNKIGQYKVNRDLPGVKGTSGLSPYLAIGAISSRTLAKQLISTFPDILWDTESSEFSWFNELIWRDFYRHLLFHYPELIKGRCFNTKYDKLIWPDVGDNFTLWCKGKTGFPIIDAAMRQLKQTGWMHNRLRMIVASFLTKNLLVNWRLGESYFMRHLIDGDFAANNGGWQWSAGTGCDAQPYFRVFNPQTQSKKFDPSGAFIRKYLPELNDVPDKHIHAPFEYLIQAGQTHLYWPPIADLKQTRLDAIEFYGMKHMQEDV